MIIINGLKEYKFKSSPKIVFGPHTPASIEFAEGLHRGSTYRIGDESILEIKFASADGILLAIDIVLVKTVRNTEINVPDNLECGLPTIEMPSPRKLYVVTEIKDFYVNTHSTNIDCFWGSVSNNSRVIKSGDILLVIHNQALVGFRITNVRQQSMQKFVNVVTRQSTPRPPMPPGLPRRN